MSSNWILNFNLKRTLYYWRILVCVPVNWIKCAFCRFAWEKGGHSWGLFSDQPAFWYSSEYLGATDLPPCKVMNDSRIFSSFPQCISSYNIYVPYLPVSILVVANCMLRDLCMYTVAMQCGKKAALDIKFCVSSTCLKSHWLWSPNEHYNPNTHSSSS